MEEEMVKASACIDYLKVAFLYPAYGPVYRNILMDVFDVDPDVYDREDFGGSGFTTRMTYDASMAVLADPIASSSRKDVGDRYFVVELSGQACREFEQRSSWEKLFSELVKYSHDVKRIDVALDDYSGFIPIEELRGRIVDGLYCSRFRASPFTGRNYVEEYTCSFDYDSDSDVLDYAPVMYPSRKGWSCTFGTAEGTQLQFYDKRAERLAKGVDVSLAHWLRAEMRFRQAKANSAFNFVAESFRNGTFMKLASSLLLGMIDFKEVGQGGSYDHADAEGFLRDKKMRNVKRYRTWSKWSAFLGEVALYVPSEKKQVDLENLVEKRCGWIDYSVSPSLLMLFLFDGGETLMDKIPDFLQSSLDRGHLKHKTLRSVNLLRKKRGMKELTEEEFVDFVKCAGLDIPAKKER